MNHVDCARVAPGDALVLAGIRTALKSGARVTVRNKTKGESYELEHSLSEREVEMILAGSLLNLVRDNRS